MFGALIGVPIAAIAFGFLKLVDVGEEWAFSTLPDALGFSTPPVWWPLPVLVVAGLMVGLTPSATSRVAADTSRPGVCR